MIYIILICVDLLLIAGINAILAGCNVITSFSVGFALLATIVDFVIMIGIEALVALILHALPEKFFNPYRKRFTIFKWERTFLEWTKIRTWKKWVPDTGQLCNFKKDKLQGTETEYLYKFLVESCYADMIHLWMAIGGFGVLLISIPHPLAMLTICLPMAIISFFMNIAPLLIQRYNRPKLLKVYERGIRKEMNK